MNFTIRDFRLHISFFFLAALTFLLLTDRDGVAPVSYTHLNIGLAHSAEEAALLLRRNGLAQALI